MYFSRLLTFRISSISRGIIRPPVRIISCPQKRSPSCCRGLMCFFTDYETFRSLKLVNFTSQLRQNDCLSRLKLVQICETMVSIRWVTNGECLRGICCCGGVDMCTELSTIQCQCDAILLGKIAHFFYFISCMHKHKICNVSFINCLQHMLTC